MSLTKFFEKHLDERLQSSTEIVGYLEAVLDEQCNTANQRDAREALLALAIKDVIRALKSCVGWCAGCGGPHDFDTSVPSAVWNRVIRAKGLPEYLCATCIMREFVRAGDGFTATLWSEEFNGVPIEVVVNGNNAQDAAAVSAENNQLRVQVEQLRADLDGTMADCCKQAVMLTEQEAANDQLQTSLTAAREVAKEFSKQGKQLRAEQDRMGDNLINLLAASACDAHQEQIRGESFDDFQTAELNVGCHRCASERLAALQRENQKAMGKLEAALTKIFDSTGATAGEQLALCKKIAYAALPDTTVLEQRSPGTEEERSE